MQEILFTPLTKAIKAYLALDPNASLRLTKLEGKVITINLKPFHFTFQCRIEQQEIKFSSNNHLPANAEIIGTPLCLLGAMLTTQRQRFFANDIVITGDAAVAQDMIALFDQIEIDWEEHLSRLVGDVAAFRVSRRLKRMRSWWQQSTENMTSNISDYLQEELQWLPQREALQDFFHEVDTLRMDTDRLEAKVLLLKQQIEDTM